MWPVESCPFAMILDDLKGRSVVAKALTLELVEHLCSTFRTAVVWIFSGSVLLCAVK